MNDLVDRQAKHDIDEFLKRFQRYCRERFLDLIRYELRGRESAVAPENDDLSRCFTDRRNLLDRLMHKPADLIFHDLPLFADRHSQ